MAHIIDELDRPNLPPESILVGFDIVNMFRCIDYNFGLKTVSEILEVCVNKFRPGKSFIEALELSLSCNNFIFDNKDYLQVVDISGIPHMPCSYADFSHL